MTETILMKCSEDGTSQYRLILCLDKKYEILRFKVAREADYPKVIGVFKDEKEAKVVFEKI